MTIGRTACYVLDNMAAQSERKNTLQEETEADKLDRIVAEIAVEATELAPSYTEDSRVPHGGE